MTNAECRMTNCEKLCRSAHGPLLIPNSSFDIGLEQSKGSGSSHDSHPTRRAARAQMKWRHAPPVRRAQRHFCCGRVGARPQRGIKGWAVRPTFGGRWILPSDGRPNDPVPGGAGRTALRHSIDTHAVPPESNHPRRPVSKLRPGPYGTVPGIPYRKPRSPASVSMGRLSAQARRRARLPAWQRSAVATDLGVGRFTRVRGRQ